MFLVFVSFILCNLDVDLTYISQSLTNLPFIVNSENRSQTKCYNISVDFQSEGICDIYKTCSAIHLLSQLMKSNENDSVSIKEVTTEVIVELPSQCTCLVNETSSFPENNNDAVIAASVLSVVVAIAVVAVIVVIVLYRRKTKHLDLDE